EVAAGHALGEGAASAGDLRQDALDPGADALDLFDIRAVNLDPYRSANAGGEHVDAVFYRHRPGVRDAGDAQRVVHFLGELVGGDVVGRDMRAERADPFRPLVV